LNTIIELADVVVTLRPTMSLIKGLQRGSTSIRPAADRSFGQIQNCYILLCQNPSKHHLRK